MLDQTLISYYWSMNVVDFSSNIPPVSLRINGRFRIEIETFHNYWISLRHCLWILFEIWTNTGGMWKDLNDIPFGMSLQI